mgnify:FL=1|jgi:hypothetical protein|tara:strand:- start:268 stop:525 length:258 start_codon:yes stop_codon:yes gene_type:complete
MKYKFKDFARQDFLDNQKDQARLEHGTQVQFFKFTFDDFVLSSMIPAGIVALLFFVTNIDASILFGMYGASIVTMFIFYLFIGTN